MICAGGRKTKRGCKGRRDSRAAECKKKEKCESRPVAINYSLLEHALAGGAKFLFIFHLTTSDAGILPKFCHFVWFIFTAVTKL